MAAGRVDPDDGLKRDRRAGVALGADRHASSRAEALRDARDLEQLATGQPERGRRTGGLELQRQHAHVDEIAAVNALEAFRDDGTNAEQERALRRPIA